MEMIPILTEENKKTLGKAVKTDWGTITLRGIFNVPCEKHKVFYDCRVGCLLCYKERRDKCLDSA